MAEIRKAKRRKDSFWGVHVDFHATPRDGCVIGATLKESEIREICETLKPDYLQIDCKGHPGWASYPSEIGNAMPEFACDPLEMWRRITKEYGIGLYMHYSGVYDVRYCSEHPEERIMKCDGSFYEEYARLDGRYADELMIPQICELAEKYQVDGVWIDGECWAAKADYHPETIKKFEETTGLFLEGKVPACKGDAYFEEYMEFNRDLYRSYLGHYVEVLHEKYPELQICSNYAFSDRMPEKVWAGVDFVSGDLNPLDTFTIARYSARMLAMQEYPWDIIIWNYRYLLGQAYGTQTKQPKQPVQLMQEAAAVIALGGAVQDYVGQFPDGSPEMKQLRNLKPLAEFVRAREPYCFKGKFVHQAALLVSTCDRYAEMTAPFTCDGRDRFLGMTSLLCDSGQSLEIVSEHVLEGRYAEYPMIIVPELYRGLSEDTISDLRKYVENGGSLLLIGTNTSHIFAKNGFGFETKPYGKFQLDNDQNTYNGHDGIQINSNQPSYFSLDDNDFGVVLSANTVISSSKETVTMACLYDSFRSEGMPFAQVFSLGKGKIGVIGADFGMQYKLGMQHLHRKLIQKMAAALYTPIATIESAVGILEIVCLEKGGRLLLQLVNVNGDHRNMASITETQIPPVLDICISVEAQKMPEKLILYPEERELTYSYKDGRVYFCIDRVDIHSIVEVCL